MKLDALKLTNFKGIKAFKFNPGGKDCSIFGTNGIGKTTIIDGMCWLLFDKDAAGKSLNPKTLDADGGEIHNLEHEIEGIFSVDDGDITLKKVFLEKWTKKRGASSKTFTGHETNYFVDGVPVKKNEYIEKVKFIATPEMFMLLSDVDYFAGKMHWEKRRELILEICGDVSDDQVISENKDLAGLPGILGRHSVDDYKKIVAARRKKINEELAKIPIRIDEAELGKHDTGDISLEDASAIVESVTEELKKQEARYNDIENNVEVANKTKELRELEGDMVALNNEKTKALGEGDDLVRKTILEHQATLDGYNKIISDHHSSLSANNAKIESLNKQASDLRDAWYDCDSKLFDAASGICPTCEREYDSGKIDDLKKKFNIDKANNLDKINRNGKQIKEDIDTLLKINGNIESEILAREAEADEVRKVIANLKDSLVGEKEIPEDLKLRLDTIGDKIHFKKAEIQDIKDNCKGELLKVGSLIDSLKGKLKEAESVCLRFDHNKQADHRIMELAAEEKELVAEYQKLEGELFLTEEFTRAKVNSLEDRINSKFKIARFKMFEEQINGGLKEICSVVSGGVPYEKGLNNAARINVGIDIINTLSEHYGTTIPIIIDNAEAVVDLEESQSQTIRLVVSEKDSTLRVE